MDLGNNLILKSDGLQFIIAKRSTLKSGKVVDDVIGYFNTLSGALKFMVDYEIKATEFSNIQAVSAQIDSLKHRVEGVAARISRAHDALQAPCGSAE
ncbi:hypothetical protein DEALK_09750 [Dehalogenimonas alkenigignens]|uniref:Uncharacterized protein n=1 Tax=Dehalogenimonas alkenigignens TaxID=1217799 RepID=A0A0W0GHV6_9CHLR|nr:hypothetical protein [Dehalogenimonas alkenigignens]KTB48130.1 hypothetical protein DEALK_09750 [Dehalogenimonas alkenigignens]